MNMFCYQCEQTSKGTGCVNIGICGKKPDAAKLQDDIVAKAKELAFYLNKNAQYGNVCISSSKILVEAFYSTVTNVSFDTKVLDKYVSELNAHIKKQKDLYLDLAKQEGASAEAYIVNLPVTIDERKKVLGEDVVSLQEIITYGLKGTAAYFANVVMAGKVNDDILKQFFEIVDFLNKENPTVDELVSYAMKTGELNFKAMELLDGAHTDVFGHPEPTQVRVNAIKGKAILVSGHDLKTLDAILKQTEGKAINVYTHGEMLPCLAYPALKKYSHLVGNYGGAWQDQKKEFREFPGSIIMTTNCIQYPVGYDDRIFTTGVVSWSGVQHIANNDFAPAIKKALSMEGFTEDQEDKKITIGFAHNAVLSAADKVVDLVKQGKIKHFFLIGGCDGAKSGRNYFTDLAASVPNDTIILTLACGKFRFNKMEFGDIEGIPRLLDIGQCNDAYSAIKIAVALAEVFDTDVNSLPLSMILSWYEQKAVAILLTLLHLGVKNIRLGPTLPAFITPNVLNFLVENFAIKPVATAEEDLKAILGQTV